MLVACRLAGLSALEPYHAGVRASAQFEPTQGSSQHGRARKGRQSFGRTSAGQGL